MGELSEKNAKSAALRPSTDFLFALLPLLAMSTYIYGWRVAIMAGISLVTAFLCDLLTALATSRRYDVSDVSSLVFALVFTVLLPASAGYHIVLLGTAVTVLLGKQAFGGYNGYPFHPSAFGFAVCAVCFEGAMFKYPKPFTPLGLGFYARPDATLYSGISETLRMGGVPDVETTDLLVGSYRGPLGASFCLIILACGALLIARGTISWRITASFLLTCSAFAWFLPRVSATSAESLMYEMLTGAVVFAAVFMIPSPSVSPTGKLAQALYGITMGLAVTLFRRDGYFDMGVCFATMLINPLAPWFDRVCAPKKRAALKEQKRAERDGESE